MQRYRLLAKLKGGDMDKTGLPPEILRAVHSFPVRQAMTEQDLAAEAAAEKSRRRKWFYVLLIIIGAFLVGSLISKVH
jgi:hypothetical protein